MRSRAVISRPAASSIVVSASSRSRMAKAYGPATLGGSGTELRARLAAVLRRTTPRRPAPVTIAGPVQINHHTREVRVGEHEVRLSGIEYRLLCHLASEPTRVFTRSELMREVWGYRAEARTRTLDSHAYRLRRRLGTRGLVANVWGVGYSLLAARS